MNKILIFFALIIFFGLLGWNIFLTDKLTQKKSEMEHLEFKLDMCRGDIDVLSYDLVTARDSLRILHEFPESIRD